MGVAGRRPDARIAPRGALVHVGLLVLHDRPVRVLMGRGWRPVVVGAAVVVGTFVLAKAQIFEPSAPAGTAVAGHAVRGKVLFAQNCATCHGTGGQGGGVGPKLVGAGLDTATVSTRVQQ